MGAFILHLFVSQATPHKTPIACNGFTTAITRTWGLEPQLRQMTPLLQGGQLNLAACIQMEMLVMHPGKVHANHHGFSLFSLPIPTLTSVSDPSNWTSDDDINRISNDEAAPTHSLKVRGDSSGGGDVSPSGEDGSDLPSRSGAVPLEEEYTPPFDPEPHWGRLLGLRCYPLLSVHGRSFFLPQLEV